MAECCVCADPEGLWQGWNSHWVSWVPKEPQCQQLSPHCPSPWSRARLGVGGLWQKLLLDRHWGGSAQEASAAGAQAPQGWPSRAGGAIKGWWWLLLLLLLVHFAFLCAPVLEPDLYLQSWTAEVGWVWAETRGGLGGRAQLSMAFVVSLLLQPARPTELQYYPCSRTPPPASRCPCP